MRMGDVGGGFGQKAYLARDEQIVILASYHLGRPVKWIEDRRENLRRRHLAREPSDAPSRWPPTPTDTSSACGSTTSTSVGAYPIGGQRGDVRRRHLHGALSHPEAAVQLRVRLHQHLSAGAVPRPVADRDVRSREQAVDAWPAGSGSIRSSCGDET